MSRLPQPDQVKGAYLITGSTGVGKTTIAKTLVAKGYNAADGDKLFCEWVDTNGNPVKERGNEASTKTWLGNNRWVFNENVLTSAMSEHSNDHLFICGITRNQHKFYTLFAKIFFLNADIETIISRLENPNRDHHFGKELHQQRRIRDQFEDFIQEFKDASAIFIDASRSAEEIIQDILTRVIVE